MDHARRHGLFAAGASALAGVIELVRLLASGVTLPGYDRGTTLVLAITFIACSLAAAAGLVLRRSWGWITGVLAGVLGMGYAVVALAGGTHLGVAYFVLGAALLYGLGKSIPAYRVERPVELGAAAA